MRILGSEVWPPDVIFDVHLVYVHFQMNQQKEQEELKEILFLIGTGLFETAHIRYIAIKHQLLAGVKYDSMYKDVLSAQSVLERLIND